MTEGAFSGAGVVETVAAEAVIVGVVVEERRGGRADGPGWLLFVESCCESAEILVGKLGKG